MSKLYLFQLILAYAEHLSEDYQTIDPSTWPCVLDQECLHMSYHPPLHYHLVLHILDAEYVSLLEWPIWL